MAFLLRHAPADVSNSGAIVFHLARNRWIRLSSSDFPVACRMASATDVAGWATSRAAIFAREMASSTAYLVLPLGRPRRAGTGLLMKHPLSLFSNCMGRKLSDFQGFKIYSVPSLRQRILMRRTINRIPLFSWLPLQMDAPDNCSISNAEVPPAMPGWDPYRSPTTAPIATAPAAWLGSITGIPTSCRTIAR